MHKVKNWLFHNSVLLLFVVLCMIGTILSGQPVAFVLDELVSRVARNSFLVLALIIPIIAGMIAGYFSNGLYQLLFLFIMGAVIPMKTAALVVSGGVGIKNTLDLSNGVKYALDSIWKMPLDKFVIGLLVLLIVFEAGMISYGWMKHKSLGKARVMKAILGVVGIGLLQIKSVQMTFAYATVPVITMVIILLLCGFNWFIMGTKLGKDFRTVGQNLHVANAAGIDVDKVRIKAIIISTLLAAWG